MKVLITSRSFGKINDRPFRILEEAGIEALKIGGDFHQEEFERIVPEYDALIIGAHEFPEEVMERCGRLRIICKHGVGVDNIHLNKAKELGIAVCNTPGTNSGAVADITFGLMISLARRIDEASRAVRRETVKVPPIGVDVCGKTLGLLGFGAIAKNMARRAFGFSMKVLAYDPYVQSLPKEFAGYTELADFDTVVRSCDFLCVHMPLTDETRGMVGAETLAKMKQGAFVLNTARGGIVDETALYDALTSGHIAGAALDVTETEPVTPDHPLLALENVIITPHMAANSREAISAISELCAENVVACLTGGELRHRVV
ncbi:MAG: phosphoglycerate dehydrogenase [Lachnospiraceae bacterium]|nr:phosphoglycerate dehydrogenase [Lachnospiraceae bacterium]